MRWGHCCINEQQLNDIILLRNSRLFLKEKIAYARMTNPKKFLKTAVLRLINTQEAVHI